MAKTRLTQRRIAALRPRKTTIDIRDAGLKGFGVRVYPTGLRRYFIHAQAEGTRIWKVVGDADDMNVNDARAQARVMLAELKGRVPTAPQAPLFEAVAEEVFRRYARNWKPRTLEVNRGYYGKQILPWFRGRPIVGITSQDIRAWFASLHRIPAAADRSLPVLSVIMTQAEIYGYRPEGSNPCHGIRRYRRKGRERFLSEEEVRRLGEGSGEARRRSSDVRGHHPPPPFDRVPQAGDRDIAVEGVPRGPSPPCRQQDRAAHGLAVIPGTADPRGTTTDLHMGFPVHQDQDVGWQIDGRCLSGCACVPRPVCRMCDCTICVTRSPASPS